MNVVVAVWIMRVRGGQRTAEAGADAARHEGFEGKLGGNVRSQSPLCRMILHDEGAAGVKQGWTKPARPGQEGERLGDHPLVPERSIVGAAMHRYPHLLVRLSRDHLGRRPGPVEKVKLMACLAVGRELHQQFVKWGDADASRQEDHHPLPVVGQAEAVAKGPYGIQVSTRKALRKPPGTLPGYPVEDFDGPFLRQDAMEGKGTFEQGFVAVSDLEHEELTGVGGGSEALAAEPQPKGALRRLPLFENLRLLLIFGHSFVPQRINAMPARLHSDRW